MINDKGNEVECTRLDGLRKTYSNFYKDVHGFLPIGQCAVRPYQWNNEEWLQEQIDYLQNIRGHRARENVRQLAESDVRFEEQMALWTTAAGGDRAAALRGIPVANLRVALRSALALNLRDTLVDEAAFDVILGYFHRMERKVSE